MNFEDKLEQFEQLDKQQKALLNELKRLREEKTLISEDIKDQQVMFAKQYAQDMLETRKYKFNLNSVSLNARALYKDEYSREKESYFAALRKIEEGFSTIKSLKRYFSKLENPSQYFYTTYKRAKKAIENQ